MEILKQPGALKAVAEKILQDIDAACVEHYDDGHRTHLGASLIAHDCSRYLWNTFRWVFHKVESGRQYRLFNRGHREEERFVEWLEWAGFKVWFEDRESNPLYYHAESDSYFISKNIEVDGDGLQFLIDEDNPSYLHHIKTAKAQGIKFPQYRVSDCQGHFGGSLDGFAEFPKHYGIEGLILLEFKTNATGPGFNKLLENGLKQEKPQHYGQVSVYGKKRNFDYVLYLNICKNDDNVHCEIEKLDHEKGANLIAKAENVIFSDKPPAKLSMQATYHKCKYCQFNDNCFNGKKSEVNCRSCKFAKPIENAQWHCGKWQAIIPKEAISNACGAWEDVANENV